MNSIGLIIASMVLSVALAYGQYLFKQKQKNKISYLLFSVRSLVWFAVFLLLLNVRCNQNKVDEIKPTLPVYVDQSASIDYVGAKEEALKVLAQLKNNKALNHQFDVQYFVFDREVTPLEEGQVPNFDGQHSRHDRIATHQRKVFAGKKFPSLIITDGNQTQGEEFSYAFSPSNPVYSVVLGDTTPILDSRIRLVNANKFAFLKNKFPIEVSVSYNGEDAFKTELLLKNKDKVVAREEVSFSPTTPAMTKTFMVTAEGLGLQTYEVVLTPKSTEKNTTNNRKIVAVEVIDQRTEVALVSAITHPDLGAIKQALSQNKQRRMTEGAPSKFQDINSFDVLIFYQPDRSFESLFREALKANKNFWVISGAHTDLNWLAQITADFSIKTAQQTEEYLAVFMPGFQAFQWEGGSISNLPPLILPFSNIVPKKNFQTLFESRIRNVETGQPLWSYLEEGSIRRSYTFGQDVWKWRIHHFKNSQSFELFDQLIDKTVQFLATQPKRSPLVVQHDSFFEEGETVHIQAQFYDKNYELDVTRLLEINLISEEASYKRKFDFLRQSNGYSLSLEGLPAGVYQYTVRETESNTQRKGAFEIIAFDREKQLSGAHIEALHNLAQQTKAKVFAPSQVDDFINTLLSSERYPIVEKITVVNRELIHWIWLLISIVGLLALEWFIRKYHGML